MGMFACVWAFYSVFEMFLNKQVLQDFRSGSSTCKFVLCGEGWVHIKRAYAYGNPKMKLSSRNIFCHICDMCVCGMRNKCPLVCTLDVTGKKCDGRLKTALVGIPREVCVLL